VSKTPSRSLGNFLVWGCLDPDHFISGFSFCGFFVKHWHFLFIWLFESYVMIRRARYLAERGISKSSKHPLLLYRLPNDPTRCYKYQFKREKPTCYVYICFGCTEIRKSIDGVTVKSIGVSNDYIRFLMNPEDQEHVCTAFEYLAAGVQQLYR
jgi:hypothetical protein